MDDLATIVATLVGPLAAEVAKRWSLTREAAVSVNVIATAAAYLAGCLALHGFDTGYLRECLELGLAASGASSMAMNMLYRARAGRRRMENPP